MKNTVRTMTSVVVAGLLATIWPGTAWSQERREAAPTGEAGAARPGIGELHGRHRVELRFGYADNGGATLRSSAGSASSAVGFDHFAAALGYSHWIRPELALTVTAAQVEGAVDARIAGGVSQEIRGVYSLQLGVRRDFAGLTDGSLRPYLTASLGPYFRSAVSSQQRSPAWRTDTSISTAFGGQLGLGLDVQLSRLIMLGGRVGFNFVTELESPGGGGKDDYSGLEAGNSLSFLFGKGAGPRE